MAMIEMTCPWCLREVNIEEDEFRGPEFRCPECGSTAPWAPDPANDGHPERSIGRPGASDADVQLSDDSARRREARGMGSGGRKRS